MKTVNGDLEIFRKKLFKLSHRQILKMSSDIHSHVKSFSKNSPIISKKFIKLQQDTENFIDEYKKVRKRTREKNLSQSNPAFNELFEKYQEKGYKIPKLTIEHSIFENNPLLNTDNN